MASKLKRWFEERYQLGPLVDLITHKQVPVYRFTFAYYVGGMTLFLFTIQLVTGILLLLYYKPSTLQAFESVKFIMTRVEFGWLIRSVHAWSANMMIFCAFTHLFSTFFLKAYRKPRELTWVSGFMMFGLVLGFGFTGYLLPWNEISYFATKVGTEIAGTVPVLGPSLREILRGGEDVGDATLTRFFAFHVAVLPVLFCLMLVGHLFLVQIQGMSKPISKESGEGKHIPFFPNFLLRDLMLWLFLLGAVISLSFYFPPELGVKADPFAPTPAGIKPEWYFLFMFQALKLFPSHVFFMEGEVLALASFGLIGIAALLVPFLDVWTSRGERKPWVSAVGLLILITMIVLTIWGLLPNVESTGLG